MSRIDRPRNERSRATRAAILDAAMALLADGDVGTLTMGALADAAGVSRRGLYLHVSSRGQLFTELFSHLDERLGLAESIEPMRTAPDAATCLRAWARHTATYHTRLLPLALAVDRARHDDADAAALWDRAMAAWRGACEHVVGRLAEEGRLAAAWTEPAATDLLWSLMSVDLVDDLVNECGWTVDQLAERLSLVAEGTLLD